MDGNKIKAYYAQEIEKDRLNLDHFKLEGIRTKEIIRRYLVSDNLNIVDIGGGAGFYAFWLQSLGHRVSLIDLSPKNIALANDYAEKHQANLNVCRVGDATNLPFSDNEFDMALLLGPLYHLTEKEERIKALTEAKRVVKPGGMVLTAIISRYASLIDGFKRNLISDDRFEKILMDDLQNGVHKNDTDNLEYFTTAFFHTPQLIKEEISESGMKLEKLLAVESVGWLVDDLSEKMKDQSYWTKVHKIIGSIESNDDLLPMSPHIIAVAGKV
jgi:ubiquinone/menaquinone biosynthesis C-methylase UbiE